MLSAVITLFETMKSVVYYSLFVSYNTGKIIVSGFTTCYELFFKLFSTLWTLGVILEEDLLVFLSDLWNRVILILNEMYNFTEYLSDSIVSVFTGIKCLAFATSSAIITCFQTIITIITKVVSSVGTLIAAVKHLVVLFGSGVWFAITLVPIFIVYICMMTTYYIGRAFEEIQSAAFMLCSEISTGIKDVFTFVTDVPLESLAGLLIISCLIYAVIVFHLALYSGLRRFAKHTLRTMNKYVNRLKTFWLQRTSTTRINTINESDLDDSDSSSDSDVSMSNFEPIDPIDYSTTEAGWKTKKQRRKELLEQGDRMCVICLERDKCILTMPCRHLCTCAECISILKNYSRTCPICRRFINYTIHVY